jgi:hypothetical protein
MNKYSIITAVAIIVIIIPVLYGVWSIFSVEQIQLRTPNEEFSYFEMASNEEIQICNPMPFFVSFNAIRIETFYTEDVKGVFEIGFLNHSIFLCIWMVSSMARYQYD